VVGFGYVHVGISVSALERPKAIADRPAILKYIRETAADLDKEMRYNHYRYRMI
jgi:hypothetical protein